MAQKTNPNDGKKEKKSPFEFCIVCKLNHDQGQCHKYFPNHKKSLSTFLSRFETKLSDIRFFLKNPITLSPELASRNRFWCVFCETDIDEIGSFFACTNAIKHLASGDHLRNLKHFLWKYGGEMDRVDVFRILEVDIAKWEKKCKLQNEAVSSNEGSCKSLFGPSNDIHNQNNYGNNDNFAISIHSKESSFSNGVIPLQYHTNEYQVFHSGPSDLSIIGHLCRDDSYCPPVETCHTTYQWNKKDLIVNQDGQRGHLYNSRMCLADGHPSNERMYRVDLNERLVKGESSSEGLQCLTKISTTASKESRENVHSGAPPPWLEAGEASQLNAQVKSVSGKSKKLNPKRVGAAWAERRKIELEMEMRGDFVESNCEANWLPNFGRVWQSGTRKESRKEFETEKQKLQEIGSQPEMEITIQPYISKRMRRDEVNSCGGTNDV